MRRCLEHGGLLGEETATLLSLLCNWDVVTLKTSIVLNVVLLVAVVILALQNITLRIDHTIDDLYAPRAPLAFGGEWIRPNLLLGGDPYGDGRGGLKNPPGLGLEWLPPNLSVLQPPVHDAIQVERSGGQRMPAGMP